MIVVDTLANYKLTSRLIALQKTRPIDDCTHCCRYAVIRFVHASVFLLYFIVYCYVSYPFVILCRLSMLCKNQIYLL